MNEKDTQAADIGDRVYAIGSPGGLTNSLSEGLISGLRQSGNVKLIQTTAAISPGSSGGGLFNRAGQLIGITTFKLARGENLNFAVDIAHVRDLVSKDSDQHINPDNKQQPEARKFRLQCQLVASKYKDKFEHIYLVDESLGTVEGRKARISSTSIEVSWESPKEPGNPNTTTISRLTGFVTVDNKELGRVAEGQCKPLSAERSF